MSDKYQIVPYDDKFRFLAIKNGGIAYLVQLHRWGKDQHHCSCDYYEFKTIEDCKFCQPCKHVGMVQRVFQARELFRESVAA